MDDDELLVELAALEADDLGSISDEELWWRIRRVHVGFRSNALILRPGTSIYRAVRVAEKPAYSHRLSYPPSDRVRANGRMNFAGQAVFYGALDQGMQYSTCLYECRHQPKDYFAVGHWTLKDSLLVNHLGYSRKILQAENPKREFPAWTEAEDRTERNALIRAWQGRIFTRKVPDGSEHLYRVTIALGRFALSPLIQPDETLPTAFAGVIYPTISAKFIGDNVALLPHFVDTSLKLEDAGFLQISYMEEVSHEGLEKEWRTGINVIDAAFEFRGDGRIVWNGDGTALSTSPWP